MIHNFFDLKIKIEMKKISMILYTFEKTTLTIRYTDPF